MTDLDKMARELLAAEFDARLAAGTADMIRTGDEDRVYSAFLDAIRAALLTAPPGYALVPIIPTDAMRQAAHRAPFSGHPETGGQSYKAIYQAMIAAAPELK